MRWLTGRSRRIAAFSVIATVCALLFTPANSTAMGLVQRISHAVKHLVSGSHHSQALAMQKVSQTFSGTAAVGALFTVTNGKVTSHFCSASVVHSPAGNLVVTAAHCVAGSDPGTMAFVPGYSNGKSPYGVWPVERIYVDDAWKNSSSPDDDVAFLSLGQTNQGAPVEDVTGAEQLGTGRSAPVIVTVVGYPDGATDPVTCRNSAKRYSATQLEFDCAGYPNGTSGGPFLADVSVTNGQGTVVGVIGGYEQGGSTPDVSYSPVFGKNVAALYSVAIAGG